MTIEYLKLSWIDYSMLCIMLCGSLFIGIYCGCIGKTRKSIANYFLGDKNMTVFPVATSMLASGLSALSLLGIPAEVYSYGTQYWIMVISWVFMGLITNYVFLPVFYNLQLNTSYEYFELRFNKTVRKMVSAIYVCSSLFTMPTMLYGPALAFNQVSGFNVHLTALIIAFVCIIYTSLGGLKGVIWAETIQFTCTLGTLGTVLVIGIISVGGISNIWEKASFGSRIEFFNMNLDPTIRSTFWSVLCGTTVTWLNVSGINPSAIQRFLAVGSLKNAKRVVLYFVIFSIITKSISCFSGLIVYAKYFGCDPLKTGQIKTADQIIPYYVLDVGSKISGLSGIFVAGLVSTALSTLSTVINTLSGTIYQDFIAPLLPQKTSESKAYTIMKLIAVVIGIIAALMIMVVEHLGSIVQMSQTLTGAFNGPLLALFLSGMLLPIINIKGIISGTLGSVTLMSIIVIRSQLYVWNGTLKSIPKPHFTFGCNNTDVLVPPSNSNSVAEDPFWLFKVSFYYYGIMGCIISIVISLLVSCMTRRKEEIPVDPKLLSPCIYRFLQKTSTTLKEREEYISETRHQEAELGPLINHCKEQELCEQVELKIKNYAG